MTLNRWATGLWQICIHHWTLHAKVEFQRLPPDVTTGEGSIIFHHVQAKSELKKFLGEILIRWGGVNHLSTFDADLRNVSFALIAFMGFPAILSTSNDHMPCVAAVNSAYV